MKNESNNKYNNENATNRDTRSFKKDEDFNINNSIFNKRSTFAYTCEHASVSLIRKIFRKINIAAIMISNINKINILQRVFGEQANFNHFY